MSGLKKTACSVLLALLLLTGCAPQSSPLTEQSLSSVPQYGKFIWHDLITDDPTVAKAFYGPLMNWSFEETQRPGGGPYTLIVSADGQYVGGIVELADPTDGADYSRWLGYYAVPAVDDAVTATRDAGGEVIVSAQNLANVARVAAVQDPEGAVFGLITSRVGFPTDRAVPGNGEIVLNELFAADPSSMANFYSGLSSNMVEQTIRRGNTYYVLQDEGLDRASIMQRPDSQLKPLWLTYFASNDAAEGADQAASLGGTVILAPDDDIRGGRIALVQDPSGAIFGLQGRDEGAN